MSNLCKDCKKRPINSDRSKRCCNACLDKRSSSQKRYYDDNKAYEILRSIALGKKRKPTLILQGLCSTCGKNHIDYSRSKSSCAECLDKRNEYRKTEYYPNNKKKIQRTQKKCIQNNPSIYRKSKRKHYIAHRETYYKYGRERRARLAQVGGTFTEQEWNHLLLSFGNKCLWCESSNNLERDHVVPISKGGNNTIENIQPLCRSCNAKKFDKILDFRIFGSAILEWT